MVCRGSSPHARGAPIGLHAVDEARGIIPACAGSTPARRGAWRRPWDHPRMRGEHSFVMGGVFCWPGSSPHARGALEEAIGDAQQPGIIPACAGSTCRR